MSRLALLESELKQNVENLKEVEEMLAMAPDYKDALDMKAEILAKKMQLDAEIATLRPAAPAVTEESNPSPEPVAAPVEKWSRENHPAYRKPASVVPAPVEEQKIFSVNDTVSARYKADKGFYPAQIISITGSSAAPIYTIKFKGYTGTETVRAHEIRHIPTPSSAAQKRKADGSPVVHSSTPINTPATPALPGVISAAASIDPALASAARKEPSKVSDGPTRLEKAPKKVKTNKALEGAKNNWQSWQQKAGTGKAAKASAKDSMFRTGESANARVGFTGSGQSMRKDAERSRHIYQLDEN